MMRCHASAPLDGTEARDSEMALGFAAAHVGAVTLDTIVPPDGTLAVGSAVLLCSAMVLKGMGMLCGAVLLDSANNGW